MSNININEFYDRETATLTYLVWDKNSRDCLIIDPLLDYDQPSGIISEKSLKTLYGKIDELKLNPRLVLETHVHADHITGAQRIKKKFPHVKVAIGKHISKVQETFKKVFNLSDKEVYPQQFDILLNEEDLLSAGSIKIKTIFTPGHTPVCCSYLIEDTLFTGDALFMPDSGTGRCDFPNGSALGLYHSVHQKLYGLPEETKVFVGHDYLPNDRPLKFQSTIKEQREKNVQLNHQTLENDFIEFRQTRDKTLSAPKLLLPSIQINIRAGNFPEQEDNGSVYLKTPLTFSLDV